MSLERIHSAIPHRPPFLMVDEIIEQESARIVCQRTFRPDEYFFQGHYPSYPIVPGVLLCEAGMQAGAVLLAAHIGDHRGVPVATRLSDVKFKQLVRPGDTIVIEVDLMERMADAFFLKAKISVDSRLAARFEFACTMANVDR